MKISIVTPVYNMEKYISKTIESVLKQKGNFDIEYIVVNDGSVDASENIVLDIQKKLQNGNIQILCNSIEIKYIYQENQGMYTAINNGFLTATGQIFTWIGGDDLYSRNNAIDEITKYFINNPNCAWVKGICGFVDDNGNVTREGVYKTYDQDWLQKGIYGRETYFVEQESTFWRSSLWKKVAPIPPELRAAGDYWLGIQFAKHEPLVSIQAHTTYFRIRPGQISSQNKKYRDEQKRIMLHRSIAAYKVRLYSILINKFRPLSPLWDIMYKCMFPTRKIPSKKI